MPITVRKAIPADAQAIHDILDPYADDGIVLRRDVDEILAHISTFFVAVREDAIVGVVAYHNYGHHLKEIRSLAVKKGLKNKGIGKLLVETLIANLTEQSGNAKIFTLTLIPEFFRKFGFHVVEKETLPEKIWKDCSICPKLDECDEIALVYGPTQ
jgi:amino-acid N-acetyltransferase